MHRHSLPVSRIYFVPSKLYLNTDRNIAIFLTKDIALFYIISEIPAF